MNELAIDILNILEKYGIDNKQDEMLKKIADNIDRAKLCSDVEKCIRCPLYKSTSHKVFGEGPKSSLMIIGDFSGETENATGRPFVGASGQLLDKMLIDACMDRSKIYITNAVKCHPPYGRNPEVNELSSCASAFLSRELEIIKPRHIIAMGAIAASLFTTENIIKIRGNTSEHRGYPVTFMFHPTYILHKKDEEYTQAYNITVDDLCRVNNTLAEDGDLSVCTTMSEEEYNQIWNK